ncbi:hypothetical protein A2U01_0085532, partial [Trifolium medium]|nr:hypothetical protein [Trifolium medium]
EETLDNGNIRRYFTMCGSDLARRHDRFGNRLVMAATVDRTSIHRSSEQVSVSLDGSAGIRCSPSLVSVYSFIGVLYLS